MDFSQKGILGLQPAARTVPNPDRTAGRDGARAHVVALDALNPIKSGLQFFNRGKESWIYEPLKSPPKSSMWDKCKRKRGEEKFILLPLL